VRITTGSDLPVCFELLVLRRQSLPIEKQELAAEKPDAPGAVIQRLIEIVGKLDVGEQLDVGAVDRRRGRRLEPLKLLPCQLDLALLQPVLGEHRTIGVDDDDVLGAVDDQQLVLADQPTRIVRRHDGGDVETARDDRGMGAGAAQIGQEGSEMVALELNDICRRKIVGHQDRLVFGAGGTPLRFAKQDFEHALDHLHDIGLALAQVRVLDRLELLDQHIHLLRQCPFGVAELIGDHPLRCLGKRRIGEDHPVHVQKCTELGRCIARGHCAVQRLELLLDRPERQRQPVDLGGDLLGADRIVVDFQRRMRDQLRPADGDAA
jgi:hypothetical protein